MHIIIENIFLRKLEFELTGENISELKYQLDVTCESFFSEDGRLIQHTTFDAAHNIDQPLFKLKFTYTGIFKQEGEGEPSLEEFAKVHGPAYIVPYARELISNITSRTPMPTIILPPINVFNLADEGLHKSEESTDSSEE